MTRHSEVKLLLKYCTGAVVLVACCLFAFVSPASCVDFSGNWQGTYFSYNCGCSNYLGATIYQNGSTLSGVGSAFSPACGPLLNIPLTGSVANGVAYMQGSGYCPAYNQPYIISFGGALITGNSMNGSWTFIMGNLGDSGTFQVTAPTVNLGVSILTPSDGTVSITPQGLVCSSSTCNFSIIAGQQATLTANPNAGFLFTGWGGACGSCSNQNSCTLTLAANATCSAGFSCGVSLASSFATVGPSVGGGIIDVTSGGGCSWSAVSNAGWITISPVSGSGIGSGNVAYTVAANTTADVRTGTITVTGQTFTVLQGTTSYQAKIGVVRSGNWFVDLLGNYTWSGCGMDGCYNFGVAGDIPVTGDWDGTGIMRIGVFRNGWWYRDMNANGIWDVDVATHFGTAGDIPVVGDWDGNGKTKIGVFRNGMWFLDLTGTGTWAGCGFGDACISFGTSGDIPVVGDWNGSGTKKIGVFRNGAWYLDLTGTGMWVGCNTPSNACYNFGAAGDIPVTGDWNGNGITKIGVFRNGYWFLDMIGNGIWTPSIDASLSFGTAGDTPIVR